MKTGVQNVLYDSKIYRIIFVRCENNEILKEMKMNVSKQSRVLEALQSGEQLTAKQIAARFALRTQQRLSVIFVCQVSQFMLTSTKTPKVVSQPSTV